MMVPYQSTFPEPLPPLDDPLACHPATAQLGALVADLWRANGAVVAFVRDHWEHRWDRGACAFCARCPHVIELLNAMGTAIDMHAEFADRMRPMSAAEIAECRAMEGASGDGDEPHVAEGGAP